MTFDDLTPQQKEIILIHRHSGNDWVCSTQYEFIRDHRKRISELNGKYLLERGLELKGIPCDGRCGTKHTAPVHMRRVERIIEEAPKPKTTIQQMQNEQGEWIAREVLIT